ncbi:MAG: ABC transporter permease [Candidatus Hodarchaeales archaeon]
MKTSKKISQKGELRNILKKLRTKKIALVGSIIFLAFILIAIFAPIISPYDPLEMHLTDSLVPPNQQYLLGTDQYGRDILSRIIYGVQISLYVGALSAAGSVGIGVFLGMISGFYGGKIDNLVMRLVDTVMAIPLMLIAIGLLAFLGPGVDKIIVVIAVSTSPPFARIVRGAVLRTKSSDYILAAKGVGLSDTRIMVRHIIPNVIGPILVLGTLTLGAAIMVEAGLSFLGLGAGQTTPTLGRLVSEGRDFFRVAPNLVIFSGLTIALLIMGVNLLGDGLRDILDPILK